MASPEYVESVYCPRCDKRFSGTDKTSELARTKAMKTMKAHVSRAHLDFDPDWDVE